MILIIIRQSDSKRDPSAVFYNHKSNKASMRNKTQTRSNADTEDGDEDDRDLALPSHPSHSLIRDVWAHNFDEELQRIATLADEYPVIALDTEFPGNLVSKHTLSQYYSPEQLDYQLIWHNVQQTKLIQVGLALATPHGTLALPSTWQFHLTFDLNKEPSVPASLDLLKQAGLPFHHLALHGIPPSRFAEGLISSGLILNKNLKWVAFHGCYDFAYLLRLLRDEPLPKNPEDFYKSIHIYFPNIVDLKEALKTHPQFRESGLNQIASRIGCQRIGPSHQAGSDSLLTMQVYFQLHSLLGSHLFDSSFNAIYGINKPKPKQQCVNLGPGPLYQYLQHSDWHSYPYNYWQGYHPHH